MTSEQDTLLKAIQGLRDEIARLRVMLKAMVEADNRPLFGGAGRPQTDLREDD